jgi:hypothetical protein
VQSSFAPVAEFCLLEPQLIARCPLRSVSFLWASPGLHPFLEAHQPFLPFSQSILKFKQCRRRGHTVSRAQNLLQVLEHKSPNSLLLWANCWGHGRGEGHRD